MRKFMAVLVLGITVLALNEGSASAGWRGGYGRGGVVYASPNYVRSYYGSPYAYGYPAGNYYGTYTSPVYTNYAYPYSGYYTSPGVVSYYPSNTAYYSGYAPAYYTRSYYGGYPYGGYISTGNRVYYRR